MNYSTDAVRMDHASRFFTLSSLNKEVIIMVARLDVTSPCQYYARFSLEELEDEALVALVLCGGRRMHDAFAELVRRYEESFLRVARGLVRSDAEAQDVVQTAFLNIFHKLDTFREGSNFKSWAYRIVTNCGLMKLRRKRIRQECAFEIAHPAGLSDETRFEVDIAPAWRARPDTARELSELRELIDDAITELPEIYRHVFTLREFEGLTLQEIGARLDLSVPAIKSRLHRARHHLRVSLEPHVSS